MTPSSPGPLGTGHRRADGLGLLDFPNSRGNDRHSNFVFHGGIYSHTQNDMGFIIHFFLDNGGSFLEFVHPEIGSGADVDQSCPCP